MIRCIIKPDGFEIHTDGRRVGEIRWDEIHRVVAFKRDAFTYDLVCLEITAGPSGEVWEVDDDAEGFWDLVGELKRVLPGSEQDWEGNVLKPAFAENRTAVFAR